MHQLEDMPILIDAHRQYLRRLYDPHAVPDQSPSPRERLGGLLVRVGHALANQCPDLAPGGPPALSRP